MIITLETIAWCIISIIASYFMHYGFYYLGIKDLISNGYRSKPTIDYDAPENNGKNLLKKLLFCTPLIPGFNLAIEILSAMLYSLNRENSINNKILSGEVESLNDDEQNEFSQDKSLFNAILINSTPDKEERDDFRETMGNTFFKFLISYIRYNVLSSLREKLDKINNYAHNKFTTYQKELMALKNPIIKTKSHYVFSSINHRKFKEKKFRLNRGIRNKTYHSDRQDQIDQLRSYKDSLQRMINQVKEDYTK